MYRSNPMSSMQKTYDDCYLICSTAVYFEKQNNEEEALRSWRNALDNIYYHNAYKIPANYRPKSETERALQESLRDMEMQCKERVDLLDALKQSRDEQKEGLVPDVDNSAQRAVRSQSNSSATSANPAPSAKIAQGTVASTNYKDIARPPLPQRAPVQKSYGSSSSLPDTARAHSSSKPVVASTSRTATPVSALEHRERKPSRTPSPEKRPGLFKTTLRSQPKEGRATSGKMQTATLRTRAPPAAGKAATLAWPAASSSSSIPPATNGNYAQAAHQARIPTQPSAVRPSSPRDYGQPRRASEDRLPYNTSAAPDSQAQKRAAKASAIQQSSRTHNGNEHQAAPVPPPVPPHRSQDPPLSKLHQELSVEPKSAPLAMPTVPDFPSYRREFKNTAAPIDARQAQMMAATMHGNVVPDIEPSSADRPESRDRKRPPPVPRKAVGSAIAAKASPKHTRAHDDTGSDAEDQRHRRQRSDAEEPQMVAELAGEGPDTSQAEAAAWDARVQHLMKNLPKGVDEQAAKSIFNEIVIKGDEVHWDDVAGLDIAKGALKEAVVYPFLRPDLFMGLREPARGMLLFGPPGTGKTMLARAVATESKSTFFAISASSLTSKFLGESEKLVRALFSIAKALTPAIIFVDEIDSLLSARSGTGEHEATRRIKTEFLIQWSDLAKAAAGRETTDGDASRVLVLAATNLPWAIDDAARRRFVRRQYIPLPEPDVRASQLRRLMSAQKTGLDDADIDELVRLTDGFSGSDITALAKDAAMGPLRSLGEQLLHMSPDQIRPIQMRDFEASLVNIRPSVSKQGLKEFEEWARDFGERGG